LDSTIKKQITFELLWWVVTAIVAFAVLYPIINSLTTYPFLISNLVFIIVFITLTRYAFLLEHTILAKAQLIKVGIVLISVPFIFLLIEALSNFQNYLDEEGLDKFLPLMNIDSQQGMINYIKSEMLFFGVGAIIIAILFPIRMVISIWRNRNTNKI